MTRTLTVTIGQHSERGRKDANQDFHGALVPEGPALRLKGVAAIVADGISSSALGAVASETAVKSFLSDYYATPDTWTVRTAAKRVLAATNSWLYAQTRNAAEPGDKDRGCVTTASALVLRSRTAHVFHVAMPGSAGSPAGPSNRSPRTPGRRLHRGDLSRARPSGWGRMSRSTASAFRSSRATSSC